MAFALRRFLVVMAGPVPAIHVLETPKKRKPRRGCPAPVYAFGFDPAPQQGAPKLLSEGGKAGHDEGVAGARPRALAV
jgi:hypothetical protein